MRIVALPSNLGGTGYYRLLFPAREVSLRGGHQMLQAPQLIQHEPGGIVRPYYGVWRRSPDGVVLAKSLHEWLLETDFDLLLMNQRQEPEWEQVIPLLQGQGKRVWIDADDDWLHLSPTNPGFKKTLGDRQAMLASMGVADGLTVSTPALADLYAPYQANVKVIRNRLDWGMWVDAPLAYERETRRVRVGWMGDWLWHRDDLSILRGVIGPWLQQHPEVEFVVAGDSTGRAHDALGVPLEQRVSIMPTHFHELDLADITAVMDIGLVPLTQTVFNNAKSHLKGLEYAACGIPCIATPTESYKWWVEPGVNGFLARCDRPRQWREALDEMLVSWREMGANARAKASMNVIQGAGADEWERAWSEPRSESGVGESVVAELATA